MHAWLRPFYSMGLLFRNDSHGSLTFLGSCFAYRTKRHFLAAAHCVHTLTPPDVQIVLPVIDHPSLGSVKTITRHPSADLAVVETPTELTEEIQPFLGVSALFGWGERVLALGYPEETEHDRMIPTARLFTGTIQRELSHSSHMGYEYLAGELSFGSPAGLSGGPVFPSGELDRVLGVVTENQDSTTFLRSVAEIQDGSSTYTEKVHEVIRYGLFVRLDSVKDWLQATIP
jgi:hypothetical protein